jgi:hypothetical protein
MSDIIDFQSPVPVNNLIFITRLILFRAAEIDSDSKRKDPYESGKTFPD